MLLFIGESNQGATIRSCIKGNHRVDFNRGKSYTLQRDQPYESSIHEHIKYVRNRLWHYFSRKRHLCYDDAVFEVTYNGLKIRQFLYPSNKRFLPNLIQ